MSVTLALSQGATFRFYSMNKVELKIDAKTYSGWKSVKVVRSIETLAGRFDLSLTSAKPFPIPRGGAVELLLYGQTIITGYSDNIKGSIGEDQYGLQTSGRDKTGDLVDASALVDSQELLNVTLREIVETVIEPFGISAVFEVEPPEKFKKFSFQEESGFEAIERACRLRGVFATSDQSGQIIIQEYGKIRANTSLETGKNVFRATSALEEASRFSEYRVFGQQSGNDNISAQASAEPEGSAIDEGVKRYRPLIIIAEGSIDSAIAQKRAEWEAAVRAARATSAEVTVKGWLDSAGELWRENRVVKCLIPEIGISGDMLIKEVSYSLSNEEGENTTLVLVRPDAYLKKPVIEEDEAGYDE